MKSIWNDINNKVFEEAQEIQGLELSSEYEYEEISDLAENISSGDDPAFQPTFSSNEISDPKYSTNSKTNECKCGESKLISSMFGIKLPCSDLYFLKILNQIYINRNSNITI